MKPDELNKTISILVLSQFLSGLSAQEESLPAAESNPVRFIFEAGLLIDNQTIVSPYKGGL